LRTSKTKKNNAKTKEKKWDLNFQDNQLDVEDGIKLLMILSCKEKSEQ